MKQLQQTYYVQEEHDQESETNQEEQQGDRQRKSNEYNQHDEREWKDHGQQKHRYLELNRGDIWRNGIQGDNSMLFIRFSKFLRPKRTIRRSKADLSTMLEWSRGSTSQRCPRLNVSWGVFQTRKRAY